MTAADDLVAPCLCQHIAAAHRGPDGPCSQCKCPEYRRDGHVYPLGQVITS